MKQPLILLGCLGGLFIPATSPLAQEGTDISFAEERVEFSLLLNTAQRNDVDFDTATHTLGAKALTPYGLILCDHGMESGQTRIDTFDDIFGTTPVSATLWNDYDATLLKCGYGLKLPLAGGELSGGIGLLRYNGDTNTMQDGKEIDVDAFRLQAKYLQGDYDTRLQLVSKNYYYHYHYLTGDYDSITSGTIRTLNMQGDWGALYAELEQLHGDKQKQYVTPPLPLPYAEFDYDQLTASLGPSFSGAAGALRYLAPTYVNGSERGTYNRLEIDNGFHGAIAGLEFGTTELRLGYLALQSTGSRDYSPVTTDLAEAMKSSKLVAELKATAWSLKLENNRMIHDGYITVSSSPIPYTLLTGCPVASCDYNNVRRENEWKLSGSYSYNKKVEWKGDLYRRQRQDTQYHYAERKYHETGGSIGVAYTF